MHLKISLKMSPTKCLNTLMLTILLVASSVRACGPGRGIGGPRRSQKISALVFKQHVPNVSENTIGAAGLLEGKITRNDTKFQQLVPNYKKEIIFKDEEGTGADRVMSQVCSFYFKYIYMDAKKTQLKTNTVREIRRIRSLFIWLSHRTRDKVNLI